MIERLKRIAREIGHGENIDLYVTILLAVIVAFLGVIGIVRFEILSAAILATLGLLAGSLLTVRRSADGLAQRLAAIDRNLGTRQLSVGDLFKTRTQLPSFEEPLGEAQQSIDICGMSLLGVATSHRSMLLDKAKRGCRIRLLLLNPANDHLMEMMAPFTASLSAVSHTQAISTSLNCLTSDPALYLSKLVEIRLYDYPLAHGLVIIDGDTLDGKVRVELYMHNCLPADAPGFYILKRDDPRWFAMFAAEFEQYWASAIPYAPSNKQ